MNLTDDTEQLPALVFDTLCLQYVDYETDERTWADVINFDWDAAMAAYTAELYGWLTPVVAPTMEHEWGAPLRVLVGQLTGRSDVTAWSQEDAARLRETLALEHPPLDDDQTVVMERAAAAD